MKCNSVRTVIVSRGSAIAAVAILSVLGVLSTPAVAQRNAARSLTVISEWRANGTPGGGFNMGIISPDGSLEAHLGPREFEDGLYIKNLLTGEDKLIVTEADGYEIFDDVTFSPDGAHVMFHACPAVGANCGSPAIYTVGVEGSDLTKIADSDYVEETAIDYLPESPVYSPDGQNVLIELWGVHEEPDEDGHTVPPAITSYVGLVSATGEPQIPERLAEGKPLFWSTDGRAIYYDGDNGLARIDIDTKASAPAKIQSGFWIMGKVPGVDAAFVQNVKTNAINVVNLDGTPASPSLVDFAASIPFKDSEGRPLRSIKGVGPHQLILNYDLRWLPRAAGILQQHTELVNFQ